MKIFNNKNPKNKKASNFFTGKGLSPTKYKHNQ